MIDRLLTASRRSFLVAFSLAWLAASVWLSAAERLGLALASGATELSALGYVGLFGGFCAGTLVPPLLSLLLWFFAGRLTGSRGRGRAWLFAALAALAVGAPSYLLGRELASGAWIAQQDWSWMIEYGVASVGVAGFFAFAGAAILASRSKMRAMLSGGVLALGAAVLLVLDARVLAGTYPEIHLAVFVASALVALVGFVLLLRPLTSETRRAQQVLASAAAAVCVAATAFWIFMDRGTKTELLLDSPVAANVIRHTHPKIGTSTYLVKELEAIDVQAGRWEPLPDTTRSAIPGLDDHNVIFVVVDTLRFDALPPARKKNTGIAHESDTPFFNQWMQEAYAFEHAYAQSSATHRSMPPMFRSLQAHENPLATGVPLATRLAMEGLTPFAVVNNFFLEPRYESSQRLLEGFEYVEIYHKTAQEELVDLTRKTVRKLRDEPFFAWIHFYNMHEPGYDGDLQDTELSLAARYQRSLRWLDAHMKALVDVLRDEGELDKTIIVFTSDHGESIGANRIKNHGPTVFEEEIRVPIAIWIPGRDGRVVEQTVGNVDILPTILDLLGRSADPRHRGRSLVPLMLGKNDAPPVPYYMENYNGSQVGLVFGDQKLIYDKKADIFYRFDLSKDPTEDENLYDPESKTDQNLRRLLFHVNPALVADELEDADMLALLARKLGEIDPEAPGEALEFLVRLASVARNDTVTQVAVKLFERTKSDDVRLLLVEHLGAAKGFDDVLARHLTAIRGTEREQAFVSALASMGVRKFAPATIAERMTEVAKDSPANWTAWLRLISAWEKSSKQFVAAYEAMLERGTDEGVDARVLNLLLENVRSHDFGVFGPPKSLPSRARPYLDHPEPFVQIAALRAVAHLGDEAAIAKVAAYVRGEGVKDVRVRQAAMYALAELQGEKAVPLIVEAGKTPILTLDAVKALEKTESEEALPFLEDVAKNHYNWIIQNHAKAAIKRIK